MSAQATSPQLADASAVFTCPVNLLLFLQIYQENLGIMLPGLRPIRFI